MKNIKNNSLEDILDDISDLKSLGKKADAVSKNFLDQNIDNGANGVAIIVFGEAGSACAMKLCEDKLTEKKAIRLIRNQIDDLEEDQEGDTEDTEDHDSDKDNRPFTTPEGKMVLAMLKEGLLGRDGMPTKKLIKKALKKIAESPKHYSHMDELDRHNFINELLGSPLTKSEVKELAKRFKEYDNDED